MQMPNKDLAYFKDFVLHLAPVKNFIKSNFELNWSGGPNYYPVIAPAPNLPGEQELKAIFEVAQKCFKNKQGVPNDFGRTLRAVHNNKVTTSYAPNGWKTIQLTIDHEMTLEYFMNHANELVRHLDKFIKKNGIIDKTKMLIEHLSKDDFEQEYKQGLKGYYWGGHYDGFHFRHEGESSILGDFTQAFSGYFAWCEDLKKTPTKKGLHRHVYKSPDIKQHIYDRVMEFGLDRFKKFNIQSLNFTRTKDELLFGSYGATPEQHYINSIKKGLLAVPWLCVPVAELLEVDSDTMKVLQTYQGLCQNRPLGQKEKIRLAELEKELETLGWPMLCSYYITKGGGSLVR